MNLESKVASLALFEGLPRDQILALANIAIERAFPKAKTIFSEGATATGFYVILTGRVKVYKLSHEGKEQILHIFGPGDPFAEAAVFSGQPFPAHAEALDPVTALFFPRDAFVALVMKHPGLALSLLAVLSRRLHRFTILVEGLSLKEVPGRLAAHLLYLSKRQDDNDVLTLEVNKTLLASLLGTIPETLSRILAKMTREGLIDVQENRRIQILDRQSLQEIASGERRLT